MAAPERKHTLQDHLTGEDGLHVHGGESDHDHDHDHDDFGAFDPETDGLWLQVIGVGEPLLGESRSLRPGTGRKSAGIATLTQTISKLSCRLPVDGN